MWTVARDVGDPALQRKHDGDQTFWLHLQQKTQHTSDLKQNECQTNLFKRHRFSEQLRPMLSGKSANLQKECFGQPIYCPSSMTKIGDGSVHYFIIR